MKYRKIDKDLEQQKDPRYIYIYATELQKYFINNNFSTLYILSAACFLALKFPCGEGGHKEILVQRNLLANPPPSLCNDISVQGNFLALKFPCNPPLQGYFLANPSPTYKISVQGNFSAISFELSFSVCWVQ